MPRRRRGCNMWCFCKVITPVFLLLLLVLFHNIHWDQKLQDENGENKEGRQQATYSKEIQYSNIIHKDASLAKVNKIFLRPQKARNAVTKPQMKVIKKSNSNWEQDIQDNRTTFELDQTHLKHNALPQAYVQDKNVRQFRTRKQSIYTSIYDKIKREQHSKTDNHTLRKENTFDNEQNLKFKTEGFSKREVFHPPFQIYVYEMPDQFNKEMVRCHDDETHNGVLRYQGFGPQLFKNEIMSIRRTWQFSLELIIHELLLQSPYRTKKQSEAQVFYVPFYSCLYCFCAAAKIKGRNRSMVKDQDEFIFHYLRTLHPFRDGKPHIMTLGKIEREHAQFNCQLLSAETAKNITFIGIEQEPNLTRRKKWMPSLAPLIVAPYPSFGHLIPTATTYQIQQFYQQDQRDILILFAGNNIKGSKVREKALKGLKVIKNTKLNYEEYKQKYGIGASNGLHVLYNANLSSWMRHSVFCLQPHGDSLTRKSFYDSVLCGCIPVVFTYKETVKYPFQDRIRYDQFTVRINSNDIGIPGSLFNLLSAINTTTIYEKRQYMYKVMTFLQYSYPILSGRRHDDAVQYILDEIGTRFNLGPRS